MNTRTTILLVVAGTAMLVYYGWLRIVSVTGQFAYYFGQLLEFGSWPTAFP